MQNFTGTNQEPRDRIRMQTAIDGESDARLQETDLPADGLSEQAGRVSGGTTPNQSTSAVRGIDDQKCERIPDPVPRISTEST